MKRVVTGHNERGKSVFVEVAEPDHVVEAEIVSVKASELRNFLIEVPRDARSAGVELDPSGLPIESDILKAAPSLVSLKFPLESI